MMLRGEPAVVINGGGTGQDQYGDPVEVPETRDEVMSLAPLAFTYSTEADQRGRAGVVTGAKIFLPAGTSLSRSSRVEVRGATYEVDGDVAVWRSAAGSNLGGLEVALRRAEG